MTKNEFNAFLSNGPILLDGATGSNLMKAGMPRGICTEAWVMEHKDVICALQKAYVESGSKIIYAPTFSANRLSLASHGLEHEIERFNKTLVSYSREAAAGKALVAGDITTYGKILTAEGPYTYEIALENYKEQIRLLDEAGVDLIVAETMISIAETLAAVDACLSVSALPIICTLTVESDGSLFTGGNAMDAAQALEAAGASAVGINCSVGPDQLVSVVASIAAHVTVPVIAKPNAGLPLIDEQGNAIYSMQPEEFGRHMKVLHESGASILGGCCGTTPEYICAVRKELGL